MKSLWEIFLVSTRLGCASFGGPAAHLGYFHDEYVKQRKWVDEKSYADLVALCQLLPGPASSQVGIGIGVMRAGILGGIVSFLGFTLPSVIALIVFALILQGFNVGDAGWIRGLKIVAVVVVAHAIIGMVQKLTPDLNRKAIAAVVGILISAFYHPIWTSSILVPLDFAFGAILFSLFVYWKLPSWMIVGIGAVGGLFLF